MKNFGFIKSFALPKKHAFLKTNLFQQFVRTKLVENVF